MITVPTQTDHDNLAARVTTLEGGPTFQPGTDITDDLNTYLDDLNPRNIGYTGSILHPGPGDFILSDTINLKRLSVIIQGTGIGNTQQRGLGGQGTTFVWDGPPGIPMFEWQDSAYGGMRDLRLEGNNNNPPIGIRFHRTPPLTGHGNNTRMELTNIHIGRYPWAYAGQDHGYVKTGILIDGQDAMQSEHTYTKVIIQGQRGVTDYGIRLANHQSVWNHYRSTQIYGCDVGLYTAATTHATNLSFGWCNTDIWQTSTSWVTVDGYNSEHSGRLVYWGDFVKKATFLNGGYSHVFGTDPHIVNCTATNYGRMIFNGHKFRTEQGYEGVFHASGPNMVLRILDSGIPVDPSRFTGNHTLEIT